MITEFILSVFGSERYLCVAMTAMVCLIASMNYVSAPSVSLEGKTVWLAQSLPVSSWQIIKAKRNAHLVVTAAPTALCAVCAVIAVKPSITAAIMMIVTPLVFVLFFDMFGLYLNLRHPNLTWTNEITPIKQSLSVFVSLFGGWIYSIVFFILFYPLKERLVGELYLVLISAFTGLFCLALDSWLKKKGAKIFEEL